MSRIAPPACVTDLIDLPALARELGIRLRAMTEADGPFLRDLYVSTRWEEIKLVPGWTDEMRLAFLHQQAGLQHLSYTARPADTFFGILQAPVGPIGRLYLRRIGVSELRVVDISLLPAWRGRGLGGALLEQVKVAARKEDRFVSIHVEKHNPARRLYQRLGFQRTQDLGVYDLLQWDPPLAGVQPNTA